mgnify:CR=1 FL=1
MSPHAATTTTAAAGLVMRMMDFAAQVLSDPATRRAALFDERVLERMLDEHRRGTRDHGFLLWKALHLALWHREYLDAP